MRRVALALFSTVTGLVMLLGFKTHASTAGAPAAVSTVGPETGSGTSSAGTATSSAAPSGAAPSGAASSAGGTSTSTTRTVTGDPIDTRFGPVQVQITVRNGTITAVNAVEYPQDSPRDQQINAFAIPQLNQEALAAKSASIDMVSGATYTSDGYLSSLQSALDQAGL